MNNREELVVCPGKGVSEDQVLTLAKRVGAPVWEIPGPNLTLQIEKDGITLTGFGLSYRGDFEQMLHRISGGRLYHEMLVRMAKTNRPSPTAVDATAGMGEDSLLLAAYGYEVTMYEQNPVVAVLLQDSINRAKRNPLLAPVVERMHLVEGNSIEHLSGQTEKIDLIYLDPMFPARQKSSLVNKKLQLIQKLEQPCLEEEALLDAAMEMRPGKIIIKRPLKGGYLAGRKPHYTVKGKAIRYDCFVFPGMQSES